MSFEDDSLKEFLLDNNVGLATVSNLSRPPVSHTVPYKELPNFGSSKIGLYRPLPSVVGSAMEYEEVDVAPQPAAAQPLRVVLAKVGAGARPDTSALGPRPSTADRRCPERSSSRSRPQLENEVRHLRRRLARCEEDLTQLRRRINQLERHRPGHQDGTYRE